MIPVAVEGRVKSRPIYHADHFQSVTGQLCHVPFDTAGVLHKSCGVIHKTNQSFTLGVLPIFCRIDDQLLRHFFRRQSLACHLCFYDDFVPFEEEIHARRAAAVGWRPFLWPYVVEIQP